MKVLLTNDDGIEAEGLQALRRALLRVPDIELVVIAPDGNRSAMARSITTRRPLWVEEVDFGDGTVGYATDGTPVDCVRLATLGLVDGFEADLIVSGINHGANLGDDITYSGTVAAALEGVLLGLPAIAVSQQSSAARDGLPPRPTSSTSSAARVRRAVVEEIDDVPLPAGHAAEHQLPGRRAPSGVEVTRLGKRIYRDELKLTEHAATAAGATGSTARDPGFHDEAGHRPRRDRRRAHRGHAAALRPHRRRRHGRARPPRPRAAAAADRRRSASDEAVPRRTSRRRAAASCASSCTSTAAATTSSTTRRSATTTTTRCSTSCARSRRRTPSSSRPTRRRSASAASRSRRCRRSATRSRCCRSPTRAPRRSCAPGSRGCAPTSRARGSRTRRSSSSPSRRSTAWRSRCSTRTACSCAARRAATARSARTSRTTCARSRRSRCAIDDAPPVLEVRGEVYMSLKDFAASTSAAPRPGCRRS